MRNNKFKQVIAERIVQSKIKKRAEEIDWDNVVKGILWDGMTVYQLSLNEDGTIYCDSSEEKRDMPKQYVLEGMDIYNKDGKCVSRWEDFA